MEIIILGGSRTGNSSLAKSIKSKLQSDMDTGVMKADEITVSTGFDMLSVIDPVYTITRDKSYDAGATNTNPPGDD